jgi:hypothetical protein
VHALHARRLGIRLHKIPRGIGIVHYCPARIFPWQDKSLYTSRLAGR